MSWNLRSSRSGVGSGMAVSLALGLGLVRNDVEREHQVARIVGRSYPVLDIDADQCVVVGIRDRGYLVHLDARLPLTQRLEDCVCYQAEQVRRHRLEEQIPDLAAEIRAHHPLPRCGHQHDVHRSLDIVGGLGELDRAGVVDSHRPTEATADKGGVVASRLLRPDRQVLGHQLIATVMPLSVTAPVLASTVAMLSDFTFASRAPSTTASTSPFSVAVVPASTVTPIFPLMVMLFPSIVTSPLELMSNLAEPAL